MMRMMGYSWVMVLAASCGGSSGSSMQTNSAASYVGVYSATYSGTYVVSSPPSVPAGTSTSMGTVTITEPSPGQLQAVWQIPPNPPSGTLDFNVNGNTGTAAAATGGMCFTGKLGNGDTQTNCCTACSITFTGSTFVQPNSGTFTGTTAAGVAYSGTYSGQWNGTKQ